MVANGYILEPFANKVDTLKTDLSKSLYKTSLFFVGDTLWREQIEQLFVNDQTEIEMVPRVGDHKIILGNDNDLETKFTNLLAFYKKALPAVGWDAYNTINIKYTNQIVCVKNKIDSTATVKSTPKPSAAISTDTIQKIQDTVKTATR